MESQISQLERLLRDGQTFTFENFSLPDNMNRRIAGRDTVEWGIWKSRTRNIVLKIATNNSPAVELINSGLATRTDGNGDSNFEIAKGFLIKAIEITLEALKDDVFSEIDDKKGGNLSPKLSNNIFIVHGHDHSLKTELESFIHGIGLIPIILHKKPDEGQTIIEKFEQHSDVGFAFVLLTPDEMAYTIDQVPIEDQNRKKESRARPNVIFEFGYFVAKLGRNRVCCLHRGDVAIPSDLNGLLYKNVSPSFESQAFSIIKELKAAGYILAI